jgi:hypothetical protein
MPRRGSGLVVIFWRDIPAQVNAGSGAEKHQVILPRRFQRAVDDAAMVAGKKTASEYVGEWRRVAMAVPDDAGGMQAAAEREAHRLDDAFPRERLQQLVANGGRDPDAPDPVPAPAAASDAIGDVPTFDVKEARP